MSHLIQYVDPGDLPEGYNWAMVRSGGDVVLFVRRDRVTPCVLQEAWIAYRRLACRDESLLLAAV